VGIGVVILLAIAAAWVSGLVTLANLARVTTVVILLGLDRVLRADAGQPQGHGRRA
jgi:hypothetical protein